MTTYLRLLSFSVLFLLSTSLAAQSDGLKKVLERDDLQAFLQLSLNPEDSKVLWSESLKYGAKKICTHLLDQGADQNAYLEGGTTPLITAVNANQPELVALLLQRGAQPNAQEKNGLQGTALMYACARNELTMPAMLLKAGADVNLIDINGDPALNWATYYGNTRLMQWLIDEGADLSIRSKHGMPVDVGLRLWHADSVMEVFRKNWPGEQLSKLDQQLFGAVQSGNLALTQKLLRKGASPGATDVLDTPLLQLAAQKGDWTMTRLLLEQGANPNQLNRVGMGPLAFAARFGQVAIVELLLQNGADPNRTGDEYKLTPLMGAAVAGNIGIAQQLIEAGADINQQDVINQSAALHWTLFYSHQEFALWLLEKGAEYDKPVLGGQYTTASMASLLGAEKVSRWLEQAMTSKNRLNGSWKVSEIHYQRKDTTIVVDPALQGRFTFTDEHYHLLYNPWINERQTFQNLSEPKPEEMQQAFQTLVFNSGSYTFTDSTLVAVPDIARVPGFEGGTQYYRYEFKEDVLWLTMYDETYPDGTKPDWYQKLQVLFKLTRE